MEAIVSVIIETAALWAPSIVAVLGIVATIIPAILKIREALIEFKKSDELKEIIKLLKKQSTENAELKEYNKLLLDEITKIKGYSDIKLSEDK